MTCKTLHVREHENGMRLDRWLKRLCPGLPQSRIEKWARKGKLLLDGKRAQPGQHLKTNQQLQLPPLNENPPKPEQPHVRPQDAALIRNIILYQDDSMLALNKPPGLAVQGGSRTYRHIDAMLHSLPAPKPHLVHRLDRDTSGVLLLAKNPRAASEISELFRNKHVQKLYWALSASTPTKTSGTIKTGLIKQRSSTNGRETMLCLHPNTPNIPIAISEYQVIDQLNNGTCWLALKPLTGKTHQLRAHMAHIGCPILGDSKYGHRQNSPLCLHARSLTLPQIPTFTAPEPEHFRKYLLRFNKITKA